MIEIIISIVVVFLVAYLISKKVNAIISLGFGGLILLLAAAILKHPILPEDATSGSVWLDVFKTIEMQFLKNLGNIGLTIMTLFGYSSYMTVIGANDVTVDVMTKPMKNIKSKAFLIPVVFLLGNLMSLVVPSASSLGILLMSTLYPILTRLEISPLTAGAVIATTATIMPTPLGADNVIAAETFGMSIVDYVKLHASISLPSLLVMAFVHLAWQLYLDKKEDMSDVIINKDKLKDQGKVSQPSWYAILPLLPLVIVVTMNLVESLKKYKFGLISIAFLCFIISIVIELIRYKDVQKVCNDFQKFFDGMGNGVANVVSLLVAASMLVEGLKALGIITMLTESVKGLEGAGIIMILAFSMVTFLIGLISGGGLSVFYATVALLPAIAAAAGIEPHQIALPMQMIANLTRSISPVAAVIVIISSMMNISPARLIKRTSVPCIVGMIVSIILALFVK